MQIACLAFPFECMKASILHSEFNHRNIAVLIHETSSVDTDDKIKQYLFETGIHAEREGGFWKHMEEENENLASADKD